MRALDQPHHGVGGAAQIHVQLRQELVRQRQVRIQFESRGEA